MSDLQARVYCSVSNLRDSASTGTNEFAMFARFTENDFQVEARDPVSF
jgi:hypothetical protein